MIGTVALALAVVAVGEFVGAPRLYTDTAQLAAGAIAAWACLVVARHRLGIPRSWRRLAAGGLAAWTAVRVWWVVQDAAGHDRLAHPTLFDAGFVVLPACMLIGLLTATRTRPRPIPTSPRRDQVALLIDSVLITGSVLALGWSLIPARTLDVIASWQTLGWWVAAYPIADLVLVTMVVLLLTTRPDSPAGRRPLMLIGAGLVAFGVADSVRLLGLCPAWLETAGHLLGPGCIALAALSPAAPAPTPADRTTTQRDWFHLLLPYVPVLVTGVVLLARTATGHPLTSFQAYLGWLGLGLVVTRQMITILDNTVLLHRVAETQRRLHHQAYHDPLTGLANRALFRERLVLALDANQHLGTPVAVLFADLDDFKLINDTYGHAMGDRVLHAIGERLRASVRPQDLVARLGGDEFAVVLDQSDTVPPTVPRPRGAVSALRRAMGRRRGYVLSAAGIRVSAASRAASRPDGGRRSGDTRPARRRTDFPPAASGSEWAAFPLAPAGSPNHADDSAGSAPAAAGSGSGAASPNTGASSGSVAVPSAAASASAVPSAAASASAVPSAAASASAAPSAAASASAVPSAATSASAAAGPRAAVSSNGAAFPGAGASVNGAGSGGEGWPWVVEAEGVGERVLAALREPYVIDGRSVTVGASIGLVAAEPGDRLSADLLLRRADAAMYAVKRRGKGAMIRYTGPVHGPSADLPQLLAGALSGGSPAAAGFEVHYQPIVRLSDRATVAVEALARWTDPVAGPVHPDVFVTMAERTGLVSAIDDFVLDQACTDAHALAERYGRPIAVHVNVSAGRLGQQGLEDAVDAALTRHALPPDRLVVEITETLRIPDLPRAAAVVERLRARGVRVALDDFGSGYNALAQLHGLAVDTVKLDSTLTDVDTAPERAGTLCRSVLAICADLGITVVGEGIETNERAEALAALGCPLGQGYLFGPPRRLSELDHPNR
ncbi:MULTISPECIES: bifunctional diguanylate cyclase/phosphodiesterase [unclassified Actinoplanes]|uniref:putative bifunctional diguanylate cyclase/phosphodiesterase n=1 Tax=unclassified Actinoplanes TaxID=2626549 RepID=UPI0026F3D69A|nr:MULTISPECIES: EAL domain-containing protein [unclassified Actinoplanes]